MSKLLTIKKSTIFKKAYKAGITVKSEIFVMRFLPFCLKELAVNQDLQFGFIISKKVGIAVERNFIRRRLKHAIQACLLNFTHTGYYIFIVQNQIKASEYSEIVCNLQNCLEKLSFLIKNNVHSK